MWAHRSPSKTADAALGRASPYAPVPPTGTPMPSAFRGGLWVSLNNSGIAAAPLCRRGMAFRTGASRARVASFDLDVQSTATARVESSTSRRFCSRSSIQPTRRTLPVLNRAGLRRGIRISGAGIGVQRQSPRLPHGEGDRHPFTARSKKGSPLLQNTHTIALVVALGLDASRARSHGALRVDNGGLRTPQPADASAGHAEAPFPRAAISALRCRTISPPSSGVFGPAAGTGSRSQE